MDAVRRCRGEGAGGTRRPSVRTVRPGRLLALALLLVTAPAAWADALTAKVVHVDDGDSLTVLANGYRRVTVRLAAIDAPEKGQPYADKARRSLAGMVFNQDVRVEWDRHDRYGGSWGTSGWYHRTPAASMPPAPRRWTWAWRRSRWGSPGTTRSTPMSRVRQTGSGTPSPRRRPGQDGRGCGGTRRRWHRAPWDFRAR